MMKRLMMVVVMLGLTSWAMAQEPVPATVPAGETAAPRARLDHLVEVRDEARAVARDRGQHATVLDMAACSFQACTARALRSRRPTTSRSQRRLTRQ